LVEEIEDGKHQGHQNQDGREDEFEFAVARGRQGGDE
jgi:hypothetical protein